jgi:hypothetical protein
VSDDDSSRKIKVVDRRWFTEDGELRTDRSVERTEPAPEPAPSRTPTDEVSQPHETEPAGPGAGSVPTSQTFLELIATLAQQAELFIAGAEGFPKQPEQAQRLIDYLAVLESKTRGNLSAEESQILSNVVFQLRTLFVQSKG